MGALLLHRYAPLKSRLFSAEVKRTYALEAMHRRTGRSSGDHQVWSRLKFHDEHPREGL